MKGEQSRHQRQNILFGLLVLLMGAGMVFMAIYAVYTYRNHTLTVRDIFTLRAGMATVEMTSYGDRALTEIRHAHAFGSAADEYEYLAALNSRGISPRWREWMVLDPQSWEVTRIANDTLYRVNTPARAVWRDRLKQRAPQATMVALQVDAELRAGVAWWIETTDREPSVLILQIDFDTVLRPMAFPLATQMRASLVDAAGHVVAVMNGTPERAFPLEPTSCGQGTAAARGEVVIAACPEMEARRYGGPLAAMLKPGAAPAVVRQGSTLHSLIPLPHLSGYLIIEDTLDSMEQKIQRVYWLVGAAAILVYALVVGLFVGFRRIETLQTQRIRDAAVEKDTLLMLLSHALKNQLAEIVAATHSVPGNAAVRSATYRLSRIVSDALYYMQLRDQSVATPRFDEVDARDLCELLTLRLAGSDHQATPPITVEGLPFAFRTNLDFVLDALERIALVGRPTAITMRRQSPQQWATITLECSVTIPPEVMTTSTPQAQQHNGTLGLYVAGRLLAAIHAEVECSPSANRCVVTVPTTAG